MHERRIQRDGCPGSVALVVALMAACSSEPMPPRLPVGPGLALNALPSTPSRVTALAVRTSADMNDAMATRLDVVFVHDSELAKQLPVSAPLWFSSKEDTLLKYGNLLSVWSLELTVQDETGLVQFGARQQTAQTVLIYANYLPPVVPTRVNISVFRCPHIALLRDGISVAEGPYWIWWDGETNREVHCKG